MACIADRIAPALVVVAMAACFTAPARAQDEAAAPAAAEPATPAGLESDAQKVSYAIGMDIGSKLKAQGVPVDVDAMISGLRDGMASADPKITPEQMQQAMMALSQKMQSDQMKTNTDAGKAYLVENGKKEGVKTTASGLQYEVLKEGQGDKPGPTDTVTVHYTGTLLNGQVFDSSEQRGEPASFSLDGVVPGWSEGVQLMTKGARYRFVIPPDLAYGEQGAPRAGIGPNSTLIFEVELLDVKKSE